MATISITGLTRTSHSQERTSKLTLPIPDEWKHLNLKELRDELARLGYKNFHWKAYGYEAIQVKVVPSLDTSCYHTTDKFSVLSIRRNESPAEWLTKHTRAFEQDKIVYGHHPQASTLEVFNSSVALVRTERQTAFQDNDTKKEEDAQEERAQSNAGLRPSSPDSDYDYCSNYLPKFQLYSIDNLEDPSRLPASIRKLGGYIAPMFQCEAAWLAFNHPQSLFDGDAGIKVCVNGVNGITGEIDNQATSMNPAKQDYFCESQSGFGRIAVKPGVFRQITATPINAHLHGSTAATTTLRFDFFPQHRLPQSVRHGDRTLNPLDTPKQNEIGAGEYMIIQPQGMQFPQENRTIESYDPDKGVTLAQLIFDSSTHLLFDASTDGAGDPEIYVRMEDGRTIILRYEPSETVLKLIERLCEVAAERYRIIFEGVKLLDYALLSDEKINSGDTLYAITEKGGDRNDPRITREMAGVSQCGDVVKDTDDPRCYAYESARRTHVHLINASVWKSVTGRDVDIERIVQADKTYHDENGPWLELSNELNMIRDKVYRVDTTGAEERSAEEQQAARALKRKRKLDDESRKESLVKKWKSAHE